MVALKEIEISNFKMATFFYFSSQTDLSREKRLVTL